MKLLPRGFPYILLQICFVYSLWIDPDTSLRIFEYFPTPCPNSGYACPNDKKCVEKEDLCNGVKDCRNGGEDENPELCQELECSRKEGRLRCPEDHSSICIPFSQLCNGEDNCPDGKDEAYCFHRLYRGCLTPFERDSSDVSYDRLCQCFCYMEPSQKIPNRRGLNSGEEKSLCLERDSSRICDGISDCVDGRDEDFEVCSPKVVEEPPRINSSRRFGKALEDFSWGAPRIMDKFERKESIIIFALLAGSGFMVLLLMMTCFVIGSWGGLKKPSPVPPPIVTAKQDPEYDDTRSSTATEMTDVFYEGGRRKSENRTFCNFVNDRWNWNLSTLIRELGRGFYGRVFLVRDEMDRFVAVKTAERDRNQESNLSKLKKRILNNEVDILIKASDNENIIKLLGYNRDLELIILEFCHKGSLLEFIIENRSSYIDELDVKTQELISDKTYYASNPGISKSSNSLPRSIKLRSSRRLASFSEDDGVYEKIGQGDSMLFNTRRLLKWANQIAKGMKF
ncbi:LRP2 [Lepeophtheirus salmonis]|uniref:LRP2 n=1 Tax=Lepeophtheirus salmonis TaxID=72036 RepID=A0A7R8CR69_LEPSM|nr:LRP2 [Lepeophtheirus salmonis]CAF2902254.1 LRP2 [Lepeophtheirus salmonis]